MEFIPVNRPLLNSEDFEAVVTALNSTWISGDGPFLERFETDLASLCSRKFAVACNSGTSALDLIVEALELVPGDEVICSTFSIISTVSALARKGVKLRFVGLCRDDLQIRVEEIESAISPKTKAIFVSHIYGLAFDAISLEMIAKKHGVVLIEDAAEAIGQSVQRRPCGSFGLASVFSFYANKHVTCGEGGAVLTDDEEFASKIRYYGNLCFGIGEKRFIHQRLGYNYRMSSLQAALGSSQLGRLEETIHRKIKMATYYIGELSSVVNISFMPLFNSVAQNHFWVFPVFLSESCSFTLGDFRSILDEKGIGTRPMFYPLHRQPCLLEHISYLSSSVAVADDIFERGLYLPSGVGTSEEEIERVIEAVKSLSLI